MIDIAIIGAGVIGTAIARELARYDLNIVILEKDNDVSNGTTKANSAIIHAGYDAPINSLRGILNTRGNEMFDQICDDLSVPFKRVGSLVVAKTEDEVKTINELYANGLKLKVPNMRILNKEEILRMEPNLNKQIISALYAPTAGIVEPWELAIAYCENAMDNGVELKLNFEVKTIEKKEDHFIINSGCEEIKSRYIINSAGVYADKIYNMVTDSDFEIHPRKGQYFLLDKEAYGLVKHIIFPSPSEMGKGILLAPTVDGNIIVGPDSEDLGKNMKESIDTTTDRLNYIKESIKDICEIVPYKVNITTFAGLRAEPSNGDFIIEISKKVNGFINVAGIKSPGLSSAPAIAEYIVNLVKSLTDLTENIKFSPHRRKRIKFMELSDHDKNALIKENPQYGRIICRCEMITEGEIVDAIHRNAGGRTINGIKRRVRPGAGRCQGGFCGPKVMEILSRELNLPMESIVQENKASVILTGITKVGE
ncbi:MAG: NAD(P)/FAD-dependent oxidoreductase [Clostridiales bacterium]|nr:NAD(P)/FAD-dependent oxidoreductase [Clostridiales bacterium]